MRATVAVLFVACSVLANKEESPRKSRQIFNPLVHSHGDPVLDYIQNVQIVDPTIQTFGVAHPTQILPHVLPTSVTPTAVPFQEPMGYSPRPYHAQPYRGSNYDPRYANALTLLSATARARVPPEHPVREETNDYHLPTPLYGLYRRGGSQRFQSPQRQSYGYGSPYGPYSFSSPYDPPVRDLGSPEPYSFPPTTGTRVSLPVPAQYFQPSQAAHGSIQYGSEIDYFYGPAVGGGRGLSAREQSYYPNMYHRPTSAGTRFQQSRGRRPTAILSQSGENRNDGSFNFSFLSEDGTRSSQTGSMRPVGTQMAPVIQGSYSYTAPDGTPISAQYFADENGFRVEGSHIPSGRNGASSMQNTSSTQDSQQEGEQQTTTQRAGQQSSTSSTQQRGSGGASRRG